MQLEVSKRKKNGKNNSWAYKVVMSPKHLRCSASGDAIGRAMHILSATAATLLSIFSTRSSPFLLVPEQWKTGSCHLVIYNHARKPLEPDAPTDGSIVSLHCSTAEGFFLTDL